VQGKSQKTRWKGWLLLLLNLDAATGFQNQTIAKKRKENKKKKREEESLPPSGSYRRGTRERLGFFPKKTKKLFISQI
jgi:hypothetical protein